MELMQAIARRKSTRLYKAEQLDRETVDKILLAGAAAPVGMAVYDKLHFTVVQDADLLGRISRAAAAFRGSQDDPLYAAPTLVVISSAELPDPNLAYVNASGIAENMALAAAELGVGNVIVWAAAYGIARDAELLGAVGLPEGFKPVLTLVFGYSAEADAGEKTLEPRIATNYL